jgi:hypothetical protein
LEQQVQCVIAQPFRVQCVQRLKGRESPVDLATLERQEASDAASVALDQFDPGAVDAVDGLRCDCRFRRRTPAINISRSNKSRAVLTFEVFQET